LAVGRVSDNGMIWHITFALLLGLLTHVTYLKCGNSRRERVQTKDKRQI